MSKATPDNLKYANGLLVLGVLLLLIKAGAYILTSSNAILTDAAESIINVIAAGLAIYSLRLANTPRDENHPYGHGKIEFVTASIEGSMIAMAGLLMMAKSGYNLLFPQAIQNLAYGSLLAGFAGIANFVYGHITEKKGRQIHSAVLVSSGKHLKSDAYSSAGLVIGVIAVLITNWVWLDNVIAIAFGAFICYQGIGLIKESIGGLMDERHEPLLEEVAKTLQQNRKTEWIDVHNVRIIRYGATIHIDAHITLPRYFDLEKVHDCVKEFEETVEEEFNDVELFVHNDPCIDTSCGLCKYEPCPIRKAPFEKQVKWTPKVISPNKKHKV